MKTSDINILRNFDKKTICVVGKGKERHLAESQIFKVPLLGRILKWIGLPSLYFRNVVTYLLSENGGLKDLNDQALKEKIEEKIRRYFGVRGEETPLKHKALWSKVQKQYQACFPKPCKEEKLDAEVKTLKEQLEKAMAIKNDLVEKESLLKAKQDEITALNTSIQKLKEKLDASQKSGGELSHLRVEFEKLQKELVEKKETFQKDLQQFEESKKIAIKESVQQTINEKNIHIHALERERENLVKRSQEEIATLSGTIQELKEKAIAESEKLQKELSQKSEALQNAERKLEQLVKEKTDDLNRAREEKEGLLKTKEGEITALNASIQKLKEKLEASQKSSDDQKSQIEELKNKIRDKKEINKRLKRNIEELLIIAKEQKTKLAGKQLDQGDSQEILRKIFQYKNVEELLKTARVHVGLGKDRKFLIEITNPFPEIRGEEEKDLREFAILFEDDPSEYSQFIFPLQMQAVAAISQLSSEEMRKVYDDSEELSQKEGKEEPIPSNFSDLSLDGLKSLRLHMFTTNEYSPEDLEKIPKEEHGVIQNNIILDLKKINRFLRIIKQNKDFAARIRAVWQDLTQEIRLLIAGPAIDDLNQALGITQKTLDLNSIDIDNRQIRFKLKPKDLSDLEPQISDKKILELCWDEIFKEKEQFKCWFTTGGKKPRGKRLIEQFTNNQLCFNIGLFSPEHFNLLTDAQLLLAHQNEWILKESTLADFKKALAASEELRDRVKKLPKELIKY